MIWPVDYQYWHLLSILEMTITVCEITLHSSLSYIKHKSSPKDISKVTIRNFPMKMLNNMSLILLSVSSLFSLSVSLVFY